MFHHLVSRLATRELRRRHPAPYGRDFSDRSSLSWPNIPIRHAVQGYNDSSSARPEAQADSSEELVISQSRLQDLKAIVADTLDDVRDLALGLRPSVLDDLGLAPAVQRTVRTFNARHALAVDFQTVGLEGVRLPPAVETALYRIVQEALTNVTQHANANRVSLLLEIRAGGVTLIVEDDGHGFEVDRLMRDPVDRRWLGLHGMRERAELLGGTLTIESALGAGTTVFVQVPLHNERGEEGE